MYKLKKGFTLPKEFKIVVTQEQSEELQKYLFGKWGTNHKVRNTHCRYIIVYQNMTALAIIDNMANFVEHTHPQIDFDTYFEKTQESFPEKWCIEVTEDNYKELNTWMLRNWTNYDGYKHTWAIEDDAIFGYFHSEGGLKDGWGQSSKRDSTFTLITTEQFRAKYGKEQIVKESHPFCYYREISRCEILLQIKSENEKLQREIEGIKKENEELKYKLLILTSKIEAAKIVLD